MTASSSINDCFEHSGKRLRHAEALALLRDRVVPIGEISRVALPEAVGRIAARAAVAPFPVPGSANSAVDGYAFAASTYDPAKGAELPIEGRVAAGHPQRTGPPSGPVAVRIFTGGVMPAGCDTVAMQEDVVVKQREGRSFLELPPGLKRGANVRAAGEDVKAGETVLSAGQMIRPQDVAQLASLGLECVDCFRRLSVGVLSTGDEILRAGEGPLGLGQAYDANAPLLAALVRSFHADVEDYGVVRDDPQCLREVLSTAAARHDVIVTSGGASLGEEDHLVAAIDALGTRHLWQIAVKPGRPLSLGHIGNAAVVGLPGNPVAVFVCALLYLRPLMLRLGGANWVEPRRYPLKAAFTFKGRKPGRREFWRARLVDTEHGLAVEKFARDGSGLISGLRASDGLIDIPEERGDISDGDVVDFIPYSEFGLPVRN